LILSCGLFFILTCSASKLWSQPPTQPAGLISARVASANGNAYRDVPSQAVEDATILAVVGNTPILAGELLPQVREILEPSKDKLPADVLERQKQQLLQKFLEQRIQLRVLAQAFVQTIPEKQRSDVLAQIRSQINKKFYSEHVPSLIEKTKVHSAAELDVMLRKFGSSLKQQNKDFRLQAMARQMIQQAVSRDSEVTHDDLLTYYREHLSEYSFLARARWEKLSVPVNGFADKAEAERAIVEMGNLVLRGMPLAEVAKKHSQGLRANEGGYHDWTSKGALVSEVLDEAIFRLPVGKLSQILEDQKNFYIIRVVERQDAGRSSFEDMQSEIRKKILDGRFEVNLKEYMDQVRSDTYVWTIFDSVETTDSQRN